MTKNGNKPISLDEMEKEDLTKYEIAQELGLLDKVLKEGWRSLSSKETGRIGGLVAKRRRQEDGEMQEQETDKE
ncbi:small, acid-soluble spore protein, alpha/beta type [Hespellia stercorisuis]|uniref:Small, acid-soluble spore protein, alpha/beta type n=1 Tax=Hespellia stercorisuis DSM 15480 TaxID=1121950 RepID=A0A1M6T223_9FIRM|nr:small, acid-soluble spore protein, alpha/beta type [Hespellia stercorisuis]SHK50980.1 Small, acid-soluble spore protein, alpha/beta type [Hespellia stercorisuis DSM 15480]